MKLSVVIPAHNEQGCIENTITNLYKALHNETIDHEIIAVDDHSTDSTANVLSRLQKSIPTLKTVNNLAKPGFGFAVRTGLSCFEGNAVAIFMADSSDSPQDLIRFFKTMQQKKVDCVFGTRFSKYSLVVGYPLFKLTLNRIVNKFIQILFGIRYNDVTNAFKLYRREVIDGIKPFLSHHFNLTVELPLKALVRGYTYAVVSNDWIQRKEGISKLKIQEMGSRYLFIILYCFIEKWLSRGDYHRLNHEPKVIVTNKKEAA